MEEDLVANAAKHCSKLEPVAARSVIFNVDISTLQSELGALSKKQLQMDTVRADERNFATKADP